MKWQCKHYKDLSVEELYDIVELRINVFVVEQNCPYAELDRKDQNAHHILGYKENKLMAYARIVEPGISYTEPSIGRVVTAKEVRMEGYGKTLMQEAIDQTRKLYGSCSIRISAQEYLDSFYKSFGFVSTGKKYLEDGIPHQEMLIETDAK